MDCREATPLLGAALDGELTAPEAQRVGAHVAGCADCRAREASIRALREGVRRQADYFRAPSLMIERIEAALPSERPPANAPTTGRARWWTWLDLGAVAASIAAIAVSALVYQALPSAQERAADEVVASHVRSLIGNRATDVASSDQHTVKPWFSGKIDFAPPVRDYTGEGFPLVGGRVDYLGGRTVAALVYRHRQHLIDVYVRPAADARERSPAVVDRQGYHLVHWSRGGMEYWAISDLDRTELESLVRTIAAP